MLTSYQHTPSLAPTAIPLQPALSHCMLHPPQKETAPSNIPIPQNCPYHPCINKPNTVDIFGDHLLSCKNSKTPFSNHIRDTIGLICHTVGPISGLIAHPHDVSIEPTHLVPEHPIKRPADVSLTLSTPTSSKCTTVTIGITIPATPTPHLPLASHTQPQPPKHYHRGPSRKHQAKIPRTKLLDSHRQNIHPCMMSWMLEHNIQAAAVNERLTASRIGMFLAPSMPFCPMMMIRQFHLQHEELTVAFRGRQQVIQSRAPRALWATGK
jgi:hypothetical protein